ncbi:hypothetical protein [Hyphomicrobium sp. CS1BSMeth3]|uniref:hypothetical protein n=1 Tax=Hyphomicrobium sp. CS1BSMeth3 TaxID=1892844 RepID=UPI001160437E|nr:hypothetical protein [Hyphomicrobium sp. CS1BSMeth3]
MTAAVVLSTMPIIANAGEISAVRAQEAAIDILIGNPYGETVDAVKRSIRKQERVGADDKQCGEDAWKFTISVPPSGDMPQGIKGFLCISRTNGKMLVAGLPFLH